MNFSTSEAEPRYPCGTILTPILATACLHLNPWLDTTVRNSIINNSTADVDVMLALSGGLKNVLETVHEIFGVHWFPSSHWRTILINEPETRQVYSHIYGTHTNADCAAFPAVRKILMHRLPLDISPLKVYLANSHPGLQPVPFHYASSPFCSSVQENQPLGERSFHYVGWENPYSEATVLLNATPHRTQNMSR